MELLEIEIAKSKVNDFQCELCLRVFMITEYTDSSINLRCVNLKIKQTYIFPIICTYFDFIVFCIVFDWKEMQDNKQLSENKINSRG